ncbi:MAG: hypothetical protein IPG46_18220 [Actinobacteria bacterium]|nr:hypothetical protein [Actinomycetota bacterium]
MQGGLGVGDVVREDLMVVEPDVGEASDRRVDDGGGGGDDGFGGGEIGQVPRGYAAISERSNAAGATALRVRSGP